MSDAIERQPGLFLPAHGGAAAGCEDQAHHLYFEAYQWAAALRLWELRAKLAPPTVESQFALAHCRIVLGLDDGLPERDVAAFAAPSNGRIAHYAELARTCAWGFATAHDGVHAAKLARLVAAVDPHLRSVYRDQIFPHGAGASLPEPDRDPAPLPFERDALSDDAAHDLLARHGRPRVLFFMSTRSPVRPDLEAPLWQALRRSAEALGCAVETVESHALDETARTTLAARLRDAIASFRPSVIVCQELLLTGATGAPAIAASVLTELQAARRRGCKLVGSYWDSWYDGMPTLFADLLDHLDAIHVIFPGVLKRLSPAVAAKTFCYPFPWRDPRPPEARDAPQRLRGNFSGNRSWANQSRVAWCAEIVRAGLPVDLQITAPKNPRSDSAYAEALASYAVTVNLTARSNGDRVFTLRTVEAPWFGSVLLEEDSDDTRYFMRPYEHYVPFATFDELAGRLDVLLTDETRRARLRAAGSTWVQRQFGALPFWSRLWRQLHGDAAPSPLPDTVRVPPTSVRIPSSAETYAALAGPLVPLEAR